MRAIENRGRNRRRYKTHDNKDSATDTGFVFFKAVRIQDLIEEGGEGVEEADVDAECDEEDVEGGASHDVF